MLPLSENALDKMLTDERERGAPPLTDWDTLSARLRMEGLIHDPKWFVQILEGQEAVVSQTFERILRDPRHSDVALVNMQPLAMRRFGAWRMAASGFNEETAPLFRHYCENDRFDPQFMLADRLIELVDALSRHAAGAGGRSLWVLRSASSAA